ncbi:unnamed protein product [Paramecium sonneborni]|uniref:Uncharacterized protein n=1 Tax=Paramecium sonneborni TaxID=65129 RepID=A0A8S1REB7_9CILI|nr:unnamed protein product [Paramecium sonneborni]
MSSKKYQRKKSSGTLKSSKGSKVSQKDDLDSEDKEILEALQARLPFYQHIFKQIIKMGLPMLHVQPSQDLINMVQKNEINGYNLQRLISIKLEGQPISYHRSKLAHNCKSFMNSTLENYQRFQLEEMLGLIKDSVERIELKKISGINLNEVNLGQNFDYQNFLNLLDIQKVFKNIDNLKLVSTDLQGYYEMKNIQDLKDHGNIEIFQQVRKLRLIVFEILKSIKNIIDSLEQQNIENIEEAFIQYLDLKKNTEFPFTEDFKLEESETNVQFNKQDQFSEYSAKSSIKSVKFHNQLTNSEIQKKNDQSNSIQSILKNNHFQEQQSKNQLTMIKEEHPSYEQISIINEIQEPQINSIPINSVIKQTMIKCKKSTKKYNQEISQKWDLLQQNNFEKIFYQTEQISPRILNQNIEPIKPIQFEKQIQSKKKRLLKQMKRIVYYDLCDSCKFYNGKIFEIKSINPRNPFFKYSFIDYDLESEEEQAEDVYSEIRSQDDTPSSSLQEFIEIDYKNQSQSLGETYTLIYDYSNFENFLPYQAIMLSDNRPQISSKKKTRQDSKFQSKSSLTDSQNGKLVKALSKLQQFINPEQINKFLQISELQIFNNVPLPENQ